MFDNIATWWQYRHCSNILFLHYNDLKRDLPGSVRRIASFLDIPIREESFDLMVSKLTFDQMKAHCVHAQGSAPTGAYVPGEGAAFDGGAAGFLYKGMYVH